MGSVFVTFHSLSNLIQSCINVVTAKKLKGVYNVEDPPLTIPNREVKLHCADGTAIAVGE